MRAILYVDGFNLYYRMLRERPQFKWLDPSALARQFIKFHFLLRMPFVDFMRFMVKSLSGSAVTHPNHS